jgi:hypothetical protein
MSEKKKPEYQMWFHKFLIFFALWACAVLAVLTGIQGIASTIENGMSNKVLFILAFALLIADGLFLIKVRFDLAAFRQKAPKEILIAGLAAAALLLAVQGIFHISGEDVYSRDLFTALIVAVWTVAVYRYLRLYPDQFVN